MKQMKKMTYAIQLYYISLIFGVLTIPFLSGSLLKYVALFIIAAWALSRFRLKISKFDILFLLYILCMVFTLFYTLDFDATKQRIISNIQFFILLLATGSYSYSENEIEYLTKSLVWASRITAIVLLIAGASSSGRMLLSSDMLKEDPNYLNGYFLFGTVYAIKGLMSLGIRKKILSIAELLLYIYCCLSSGSRGGMFCLIFASSVYLIVSNDNKNFLKNNLKKFMVILLAILVVIMIIPFIPEDVLSRFTFTAIIESNGTHRYEFWGWAVSIFKESNIFHQLFGYGAGAIRSIFSMNGYLSVVAHNLYVEQLLEGGVVLSIIYISMMFYLLIVSYKRKDYMSLSIICGFIMLSLSTSLYAFKPFWAIMMFVNLRRKIEI